MLSIHTDPPPLELDPYGVIRVGKTRVTLDTVMGAFDEGLSAEEIVLHYDVLRLADVYATISYALNHKDEVEAYLKARRIEAKRVRAEDEARYDTRAIRAKLRALRNAQE